MCLQNFHDGNLVFGHLVALILSNIEPLELIFSSCHIIDRVGCTHSWNVEMNLKHFVPKFGRHLAMKIP
jgi:MarR-like DNA-binding transcriptional regulator SgrR of sgrS sRNA